LVTTFVIAGAYTTGKETADHYLGQPRPASDSIDPIACVSGCQMVDRQKEGGGKMLEVQQKRAPAQSTGRFLGERPVPPGVMTQLKKGFAVDLREQESNGEILKVLDRAAEDNGLIAELTHRGSKALEGYKLTLKAKAALLSGDIRWIEARVGKLDARLRTWLDCRLQQEIW
jgi:hypothetical protein